MPAAVIATLPVTASGHLGNLDYIAPHIELGPPPADFNWWNDIIYLQHFNEGLADGPIRADHLASTIVQRVHHREMAEKETKSAMGFQPSVGLAKPRGSS